jgi:hypothetical protein
MDSKILATHTLAKMWGVSRAKANYKLHNSDNWMKAEPSEVGSCRTTLNIWKFSEHAKATGYSIAQDKEA